MADLEIPTLELNGTPTEATPQERLQRSCKRAKKFTTKRMQNIRYSKQVMEALQRFDSRGKSPEWQYSLFADIPKTRATDAAPETFDCFIPGASINRNMEENELYARLSTYHENLCVCGGRSLYRRRAQGQEATLITALTCNHRLCNICNMLRANKMRRKWQRFFKDEERNVHVKKAQAHMFENIPLDTRTEIKQVVDEETAELIYQHFEKDFTSGADLLKSFTFMHLTLTVPHGPDGWNGKKYYAKELLEHFNTMRRDKYWKKVVFGGELSIETTRGAEGGLHIHIHALILVDKREYQSRNKLHEHILTRWNNLTVDGTKTRPECPSYWESGAGLARAEGIRKGIAPCGDGWFAKFLKGIDPRGSTMVGLKSLYYALTPDEAAGRSDKRVFYVEGKPFAYCNSRYPASMTKGVMECLKYHFEPCVLENDAGHLDTNFLLEVLPNIYRQRLYGKFGGFYGVKQLNVAEDPLSMQDMCDDLAETGTEAFDPATGEEIEQREYFYAVADAQSISFQHKKPLYYLRDRHIKLFIPPDLGIMKAMYALAEWGYRKGAIEGDARSGMPASDLKPGDYFRYFGKRRVYRVDAVYEQFTNPINGLKFRFCMDYTDVGFGTEHFKGWNSGCRKVEKLSQAEISSQ